MMRKKVLREKSKKTLVPQKIIWQSASHHAQSRLTLKFAKKKGTAGYYIFIITPLFFLCSQNEPSLTKYTPVHFFYCCSFTGAVRKRIRRNCWTE